ncbi:hypothetical protein C2E23DRAFT_9665 [Lenzites betulinus]|nr:hypothetical protein C2E23DRAFT_9665 [Lenzites betulinus]
MASLDSTMGAMFIGVILAGIMYGVSCAQMFYYFTRYPNDHWGLKLLVTAVWASDTVHQGLISYSLYYYLITQYGNPIALTEMSNSIIIEVFFNSFIGLFVQSFFTARIWTLSGKKPLVVVPVILLVLGEFVVTMTYAIKALFMKTFLDLARYKGLTITVNALAAAGDVVIAIILCTILNNSRTGFSKSNKLINKLIIFAVNTGLLTSICASLTFITVVALPNTFIYITFFFLLGRLYSNSLMATLNARQHLRDMSSDAMSMSLQDRQPNATAALASARDITIRINTTTMSKLDGESQYGGSDKQPIEAI